MSAHVRWIDASTHAANHSHPAQTGTGKTHTMEGDIRSQGEMGVIPRAAIKIFAQLQGKVCSPLNSWTRSCIAAAPAAWHRTQTTMPLDPPPISLKCALLSAPQRYIDYKVSASYLGKCAGPPQQTSVSSNSHAPRESDGNPPMIWQRSTMRTYVISSRPSLPLVAAVAAAAAAAPPGPPAR